MRLNEGDKVKFSAEKQRYTVQAANDRYAICTKPMNALHTVLYTIVDFSRNERGQDNLIFGHGYETKEDCHDALRQLEEGTMEVSSRRHKFIPLDIEKVFPAKKEASHV